MEQHTLKNVSNCLNTSIYSYLETSGGQSSNPYLYNKTSFLVQIKFITEDSKWFIYKY